MKQNKANNWNWLKISSYLEASPGNKSSNTCLSSIKYFKRKLIMSTFMIIINLSQNEKPRRAFAETAQPKYYYSRKYMQEN